MLDRSARSNTRKYKSPMRKLLIFFENSRNQWKAKCQEAKYLSKLLKNRIRNLIKNKEELKIQVKELGNKLYLMKGKEKKMEQEIIELKKMQYRIILGINLE
jgi:uncharacterized protein YlxW (UPF0749 family)